MSSRLPACSLAVSLRSEVVKLKFALRSGAADITGLAEQSLTSAWKDRGASG